MITRTFNDDSKGRKLCKCGNDYEWNECQYCWSHSCCVFVKWSSFLEQILSEEKSWKHAAEPKMRSSLIFANVTVQSSRVTGEWRRRNVLLQCKDVKNQGGGREKTVKVGTFGPTGNNPLPAIWDSPKRQFIGPFGTLFEYFLKLKMMMDQSGRRRGIY